MMGNSTVHFVKSFLTSTAPAQETMWSPNISLTCSPILALIVKWFSQQKATSHFTDQGSISIPRKNKSWVSIDEIVCKHGEINLSTYEINYSVNCCLNCPVLLSVLFRCF